MLARTTCGDGSLPETPDSAKASPDYESDPWYWVPEDETALRVARVPTRLKQYFRKENAEGCLKVLAEWVLGTLEPGDLETASLARAAPLAESRLRDVLGVRALERNIVGTRVATWLGKVAAGARKMQRETPLTRISDFAVVPYRQDQSPRLDFWGSDVRNLTTEGDTRWVNYNTSHFSSRSTAS